MSQTWDGFRFVSNKQNVGNNADSDSETVNKSPEDFVTMPPMTGNAASDSESPIWTPIVQPPHRFRSHWVRDNCCAICGFGLEDHQVPKPNTVMPIVTPKLSATIYKLNSAYSVLALKVDEQEAEVRIILTPGEFAQLVELGLEVVETSPNAGW